MKYEQLHNFKWLHTEYVVKKATTQEIASIVGAKSSNSVRQALIRLGIPVRNRSDGATCKREDDGFRLNFEVINGCLLGDAHLEKWSKTGCSAARFRKKNKHYDHILFVANELFAQPAEHIEETKHKLRGKVFSGFAIRSLVDKKLNDLYEKWYPKINGFQKLVPDDIEITPKVLLHWFLDDGSTSWRIRKKVKSVRLTFCSESFSQSDQLLLCEKINGKFDLKAKVVPYNQGTGWRIKLPETKVNDFLGIIGVCPVPNLAYKWKFRTKETT